MKKKVDNDVLIKAREECAQTNPNYTSQDISNYLKAFSNLEVDASTVRARFTAMGQGLRIPHTHRGTPTQPTQPIPTQHITATTTNPTNDPSLEGYDPYLELKGDSMSQKNKYKVGDKLIVREDIGDETAVPNQEPDLSAEMRALGGKILTIRLIDNNGFYKVHENNFSWRDEWLTNEKPKTVRRTIPKKTYTVPAALSGLIPNPNDFKDYVTRAIDDRLAIHYDLGKHPITQGAQGTGKTMSHMHYAHVRKLPFLLISCYEDFKLPKLFGDKTIVNGTIKFQESQFVTLIQNPSVILFDEINAVSQANTFDFHALLQNRQLFIKDADDGIGKLFTLHEHCHIGFAQNPKSAKYIGGNIRASNFLGRCTYLTYPSFTVNQIKQLIGNRYPELSSVDKDNFVKFFQACSDAIGQSGITVDISIRQIINVIDLYLHGMPLSNAVEEGLSNIVDSISQPKAKEAFTTLVAAVWKDQM